MTFAALPAALALGSRLGTSIWAESAIWEVVESAGPVIFVFGTPLLAWGLSRRLGTNDPQVDLGIAVRPIDLIVGALAAFTCMLASIIGGLAGLFLSAAESAEPASSLRWSESWEAALLVGAVGVLSPLSTQIVYRGIILRGLTARLGSSRANLVQIVVSGLSMATASSMSGAVTSGVTSMLTAWILGGYAIASGRLGGGMVALTIVGCANMALAFGPI